MINVGMLKNIINGLPDETEISCTFREVLTVKDFPENPYDVGTPDHLAHLFLNSYKSRDLFIAMAFPFNNKLDLLCCEVRK